ncbi:MAG: replication-relaxation family protein [Pirellulaceae bacterium]
MITPRKSTERRLAPHHPALLAFVHQHRFVTAEQLLRRYPEYLGTLRTAQKHAKTLADRGLLARAPVRAVLPTFPHVYFTTARGRNVIGQAYHQRTGQAWPESRGEHYRQLRPYNIGHIEHELAITNLDLAVHHTAAARPDVTLANVQRRYHHEMSCEWAGGQITVQPDARYDLLHQREARTWLDICFVELDRGTSARGRWRQKLRHYDIWASSSAGARHLKQLCESYGDHTTRRPNFRLLVVAQARGGEGDDFHRLIVLLTECLELTPPMQARIWATRYTDIHDNVDGAIWYRWRDARRWRPTYLRHVADANPRSRQLFVAKRVAALRKYALLPPKLTRLRSG